MTLLALALWLCLSGAPPPFTWDVPEAIDEVPMGKAPSAAGRPMKLRAVRSRWGPDKLRQKLVRDFQKAGLVIPPGLPQNLPLPYIAAIDGRRMISYSAFFQANRDGSTTLILGEVDLEARVSAAPVAPVFPGAVDVVTSDVEVMRSVSYRAKASPAEVLAFYREVLGRAGYRDSGGGVFERGPERVQVLTPNAQDGLLRVVVMVVAAGERTGNVGQDGAGAPPR